ncbi:type 1 glutamine amidotransferase domain-containing protein [Actinospica sp.]|uniref:type 1 glutamine amidotransferase domain-containing protein n=1 Tax=Actinospica sp. TaxID=1872142 RepID=UPI002CE3D7EB|nr:type 1 glutamine amidotransferase domain-containing protein [Actinospica sp.]HWG26135.1 type 1 glutamine amidotransferase domain-containing protein [Actinospica sp.]
MTLTDPYPPPDSNADNATASRSASDGASLTGRNVAFLVAAEGAEQSEMLQPWEAVTMAGGRAVLVCPQEGEAQLFDHLDRGRRLPVDLKLRDADAADFDTLVLPGGVANPDMLRLDEDATRFARAFFAAGKPVAAICHAPWLLVEADLVRDRTLTSWPSLRTDIGNAGGRWRDEAVVVDEQGPNTLVTSRRPQDLPEFRDSLVRCFASMPG